MIDIARQINIRWIYIVTIMVNTYLGIKDGELGNLKELFIGLQANKGWYCHH
jgi:hypothetical protein